MLKLTSELEFKQEFDGDLEPKRPKSLSYCKPDGSHGNYKRPAIFKATRNVINLLHHSVTR
ncbi:MAG: hypothetical protein ACI814_001437, partial [Mariniblastus sp.]